MKILLIRHGESEADILNVHEGRADFSLTARGQLQVEAMCRKVKDSYLPEIIYSSTLKRAHETATALSKTIGCNLILDEDLMEFNNGIFAGVSFKEAERLVMPTNMYERVENGESKMEFRLRIEAVFSKIIDQSKDKYKQIAIIAHGGVMNMILRAFFKMPNTMDYYFKTEDTGMHLIEVSDKGNTIHFLNEASHIEEI